MPRVVRRTAAVATTGSPRSVAACTETRATTAWSGPRRAGCVLHRRRDGQRHDPRRRGSDVIYGGTGNDKITDLAGHNYVFDYGGTSRRPARRRQRLRRPDGHVLRHRHRCRQRHRLRPRATSDTEAGATSSGIEDCIGCSGDDASLDISLGSDRRLGHHVAVRRRTDHRRRWTRRRRRTTSTAAPATTCCRTTSCPGGPGTTTARRSAPTAGHWMVLGRQTLFELRGLQRLLRDQPAELRRHRLRPGQQHQRLRRRQHDRRPGRQRRPHGIGTARRSTRSTAATAPTQCQPMRRDYRELRVASRQRQPRIEPGVRRTRPRAAAPSPRAALSSTMP